MKRSEINDAIGHALEIFQRHGWSLPAWEGWTACDLAGNPEAAAYLASRQLGWDVTDFGSGRFTECGLVLFCLRNGIVGVPGERTYAEKLLVVGEGQVTPTHRHASKMEDIINRAGGNLVIEFCACDDRGAPTDNVIEVAVDGMLRRLDPWQPLVLKPGEGVTIPTGLYHRFYGREGCGAVLVGEVSQVNDDRNDNFFLDPVGRFAEIEEDVPPLRRLWNEGAR